MTSAPGGAAPDGGAPTEWRWGCIACGDTGRADSPAHALSLEGIHRAFACPRSPGLDPFERARRMAWWKIRRARYPQA